MSFSKAKILRFNDIKSCAPSPSKYGVSVKTKAKSATISSNADGIQSPATSDNGSVSGSVQSVPGTFKTPTLPKRKKTVVTTPKSLHPKDLFPINNKKTTTQPNKDQEALKEKIIECENKTQSIQELIAEIDDLKIELTNINRQKAELIENNEQYNKSIEELTKMFDKKIEETTEHYENNLKIIEDEKMQKTKELEEILIEYNNLKHDNQKELNTLAKNCNKFEEMYNKSIEEYTKTIQEKDKQIEEYKTEIKSLENLYKIEIEKYKLEIETLQREHQNEMQEIEFEMLKIMTELQKERESSVYALKQIEDKAINDMKNIETSFNNEIEALKQSYETKLQQSNTKLEETELKWKQKLQKNEEQSEAILKECQAIGEYNIIQCEIEKNSVKIQLEEELSKYNALEKQTTEKYNKIHKELITLQKQYEDTKNLLANKDKEINKKTMEIKAYNITINNSHVAIEVLKKRLIESDRDVEQLKEELVNCENTIFEYENKCRRLNLDLKHAHTAVEELESQLETNLKLNENDILETKAELLKKVEQYKFEVREYSRRIEEEKCLKLEALEQLKELNSFIVTYDSNLKEIEVKHQSEVDGLTRELLQEKNKSTATLCDFKALQERVKALDDDCVFYRVKAADYEEEIKDVSVIRRKYIEQSGRYDSLQQDMEKLMRENEELKRNQGRVGKELRQKQEMEKRGYVDKLNVTKAENETLRQQVAFLEKEISNVTEKYSDIVGHHNIKQKVKHLNDIKTKNDELLQNKIDLELKLNNHLKTSEKLRKENADLRKCLKKYKLCNEDKENIGSPNRSSPFRERN